MRDNSIARLAVCPICGRAYHGVPALSREDNKTLICPDCGTRQALASIGVGASRAGADFGNDSSAYRKLVLLKKSQYRCMMRVS